MKILIAIIAIISLIWLAVFIIKGFKNARDLQSEIEDFEKLQFSEDQKIEYFYIFKTPYRKSYKIFHLESEAKAFAYMEPNWLVSVAKEGENFDELEWSQSSTYWSHGNAR